MTIALVDGDIVCYRSAASCEPNKSKAEREPLKEALFRMNDLMYRILNDTGSEHFKAFISGPDNFRYGIDPTYKANRTDKPRPEYLQDCREILVVDWSAVVSDGIEADDNLGIEQTDDTIICSIDKDLLQIPGRHYNFVTGEFKEIDEHTGWVNFYTQLIMGDRSDNILGYDGKMRQKVPQFLQGYIDQLCEAESPRDMLGIVESIYELGSESLRTNAQLLYIQRREGDSWLDLDHVVNN